MSSASTDPAIAAARLRPETTVGAVALTVSDLSTARDFYERVLGLRPLGELDGGGLAVGAPGGEPLVVLHADGSAPARDPRATGLFHLAIVLPSRAELGRSLLRIAAERHPLSGASDHLVSEALYLADPDGNGIELYRDRPREDWPRDADGTLQMATLALDLHDLADSAGHGEDPGAGATGDPVPSGTRMGHVHLQVSDIPAADAFYTGTLGFDATVRSYPGALFVSAGGYHHHVGLNTWNSRGAGAPPPGAVGLRHYELVVPDADELERVGDRLAAAGVAMGRPAGATDALLVRDPAGNAALVRPR